MKAELTIPPELVSAIAEKVVAQLRPMLKDLQNRNLQGGAPKSMVELDKYLSVSGSIPKGEVRQGQEQTFPQVGYIRLKEVLTLIPVSKSTWYKGIADGRYPKPTKQLGPRIAAWDVKDIRPLLEREKP